LEQLLQLEEAEPEALLRIKQVAMVDQEEEVLVAVLTLGELELLAKDTPEVLAQQVRVQVAVVQVLLA
jgi:hypothetical protein